MKLSTCERCGKLILPDEPALHRNGRPAQHRHHYQQGYTAQQRGRWSGLVAATRELAEGSGELASRLTFLHEAMPKRGTKPDLDAIERRWAPGAKRRRAKK